MQMSYIKKKSNLMKLLPSKLIFVRFTTRDLNLNFGGIIMSIEEFIANRGIESLYHFTVVDNLESILNYGLLSRTGLKENDFEYYYNDENRYEKKLNAICLSISFPNYKMFYKYRQKYPGSVYCVLELKSNILYEKKCLFCVTNAANNSETIKNDSDKTGINALERLFYDDKYMKEMGLGLEMPTDPQAEVLVLDNIETNYIKSINFDIPKVNFPLTKYPDFRFLYNTDLFWGRSDWRNWQNN